MTTHHEEQDNPRVDAVRLLIRLEADDAYVDRLLSAEAKRRGAQPLLQRLVRGVMEWQTLLDKSIAEHLDKPLERLHPPIRAILRLGAYELLFLNALPVPIVVSIWVDIAKSVGHKGTVGLVNAVLRRVGEGRGRSPVKEEALSPGELAEVTNHPEWLVTRWVKRFGPDEARALCFANNTPQPVHLRVNPLRISVAALVKELSNLGCKVSPGRYFPECLRVESTPRGFSLFRAEAFLRGEFTVQDESAAAVGYFIAPPHGANVVDLCAAPGGKATHLAELMGGVGRVLAFDRAEHRAKLIQDNATRLGLSSIRVAVLDALQVEGEADIVLLDAPCSGTGVLQRKSDARFRRDESQFVELCEVQRTLINHAATLVRPGGLLIYSTCSLESEEDEGMVQEFLDAHSEFEIAAPPETFPKELIAAEGFYQSLPQRTGLAGAFAARLRRRG